MRPWRMGRRNPLVAFEPRTHAYDCLPQRFGSSQLPLFNKFLDEPPDPSGDRSPHSVMVVEISFHDELSVTVDVDMARTVVTDPGQEDVPASAELWH